MRSEAYRYKDRPMPSMPERYNEREAHAYRAGLSGLEIPGLELSPSGSPSGGS